MDRERFDALARVLASPGSRRGALSAFVGIALLGGGGRAHAERGKARGRGHNKGRGKGHGSGNGRGHEHDGQCDLDVCLKDAVTDDDVFCCKDGSCSCGGACCGDRCFRWRDLASGEIVDEGCCAGPKRFGDGSVVHLVFCPAAGDGDPTCCPDVGEESCASCLWPTGIAGSYRRPGR